jgi:acyl-CoA thioesterase-1
LANGTTRWHRLFAVLLVASCARDVPHATREGPIVAFGDSLVYGTGSSGGGFIKLLEQRLGRPIENLGVPGNTTAEGLARLDAVIDRHPSIVVLLLGGNDYLRQVPRDETFANLGTIIEHLQADGIAVLLIGVRGGLVRDNFAKRFEELADRYRTAYVHDVLDDTLGVSGYMSDQVHPNDAGYRVIADRVYPVLSRMIREDSAGIELRSAPKQATTLPTAL